MASTPYLFGLTAICFFVVTAHTHAGTPVGEVEVLTKQMLEYYLHSSPKDSEQLSLPAPSQQQLGEWVATMRADGSWPDIDYRSDVRGLWPAPEHLKRTFELAKSYHVPESRKAVLAAFRYWLEKDFRSANWWHNEIGVPRSVGEIMLFLPGELSADDFDRGLKIMQRADRTKSYLAVRSGLDQGPAPTGFETRARSARCDRQGSGSYHR